MVTQLVLVMEIYAYYNVTTYKHSCYMSQVCCYPY